MLMDNNYSLLLSYRYILKQYKHWQDWGISKVLDKQVRAVVFE